MNELTPSAPLFQMMTGVLPARAIFLAAQLKLADLLASGPRPVEELAAQTDTHAESLYRVMRALASIGIFSETKGRRFGMTPMAEMLRSDVPGSMWATAMMISEVVDRPAALEFLHSVQTGRPAFEKVYGTPVFGYLTRHPEKARIFDQAMTGIHGPETAPTIAAYDFSQFATIVDVGGGNGSKLLEILRSCPAVRGVVFDLPHVIERTRAAIQEAHMEDRCRADAGDFFQSVTKGGDAYILRHILHDWDDDRAVKILRHCREAAATGGKILIIESVIPPGNEPHPGKWLDLIMLLAPGGRERTAEQYEHLLGAAGLKLSRIVPTASPVSVVESVAE
jgi:hypothetical protein